MTQGERVKIVRKALGLNMEKFGGKLGIKKAAISLIENNKNKLTQANIKAICREYGVNPIWLTTGKGEMFVEDDNETITLAARIMAGEDEFHKNLLKSIVRLNENELLSLKKLLKYLVLS